MSDVLHLFRALRNGKHACAPWGTASAPRWTPTMHCLARTSRPLPPRGVDATDPLGLGAGAVVSITPDDYGKVPVTGELVTLRHDEVAVRRVDPRAGETVVHFSAHRLHGRVRRVIDLHSSRRRTG
jgi:hypothetical protein